MKLNCLIIDDEPLARAGIEKYVSDTPLLQLKASVADAMEALVVLRKEKIDLIFLDIEMPKMNGIELISSLVHKPMIIMITAYADFAVKSYELDVVDYLLKPVTYPRFLKAINKVNDKLPGLQQVEEARAKSLFVKANGVLQKISFEEITHIEGLSNYIIIHANNQKIISYLSLKKMEEILPADGFFKIHKSYIISLEKISCIDGNQVCMGDIRLPVSKSLKPALLQVLSLNKQ